MIDYDMLVKEEWYAQGFNCTPLMIIVGNTLHTLHEVLDGDFEHIIYELKDDYGKGYYHKKMLEKFYNNIVEKIKADPEFLKKTREIYNKEFEAALSELNVDNISDLSDEELIALLNKAAYAMNRSVGKAHIIESFALTSDTIIKDRLSKYTKDNAELNTALTILSSSNERSFVNESEEELYEISLITDAEKRKNRIEEYIKKFYWIKNTYCGRVVLTPKMIEEDLKSIKKSKELNPEELKKKQEELIRKLKLDDELIMLLKSSMLITDWQDSRKKNILIGIDYMEKVLEELSRRTNIDIKYLRYLSYKTEYNMDVFNNQGLEEELKKRQKGVVFFYTPDEELIVVGEGYEKFHKDIDTAGGDIQDKDLHGIAASTGVGIGPARLCMSMEAINNFQEGEVLVASMTRPEFTPAMKKAVAIVTDEGGITSHAAIVSRELGVPCVIGTKVATKTIKNGDRIEVKANHGLVRILERVKK